MIVVIPLRTPDYGLAAAKAGREPVEQLRSHEINGGNRRWACSLATMTYVETSNKRDVTYLMDEIL